MPALSASIFAAFLSLTGFQAAEPVYSPSVQFRREVGGWEILGFHTREGNGLCVMRAEYESGTTVEVLLSSGNTDQFYFTFSNPAWRSLTPGQSMPLRIDLGPMGSYNLTGTSLSPSPQGFGFGFRTRTSNGDFVPAFMAAAGMSVYREDVPIDHFNLRGSRTGILALTSCMVRTNNAPDYDPFAR